MLSSKRKSKVEGYRSNLSMMSLRSKDGAMTGTMRILSKAWAFDSSCSGERLHRNGEIFQRAAAGSNREDDRMGYSGCAEALNETASGLGRAKGGETLRRAIADSVGGVIALAFTPQPPDFIEFMVEAVTGKHLVIFFNEGITGQLALEAGKGGAFVLGDAHAQVDADLDVVEGAIGLGGAGLNLFDHRRDR